MPRRQDIGANNRGIELVSLEVGEQLGAYKIVGPLGAGGMGEVYRAADTKLDREVALKVLPDAMAYDTERVARFEREAKLLASLNHPLIAAIYGFEEVGEKRFLVLELVEGLTLADRLADGPLMVEESLDVARQMAEALEAAHEKGIVHRDLKPANVKITPEGHVKVLDFGLAKALAVEYPDSDPGTSPTITKEFTEPGVILGTAAYMSPEQARGRPVDKRSDIWSFGCVLYECLTGDSIFRGETVTDSVGAILHKQPDWEKLPADTPPTVQLLLRRCLAKDRKRRLRDIGDVRIELEAAIADPTSSALGLASVALASEGRGGRPARTAILMISALILGGIITSVAQWGFLPVQSELPPPPEPPLRKLMPYLAGLEEPSSNNRVIISPDGKRIVYFRDEQLWVHDLDELTPRELPGTESARVPFWSPDSKTVGYFAFGQLWRIDVTRGSPSAVAALPHGFRSTPTNDGGGAWMADGRIVFSNGTPAAADLWEVSERGGDPRLALEVQEGQRDFEDPSPLPDGRGVLFVVDSNEGPEVEDIIAVLADGQRKTVLQLEGEYLDSPVYSKSGHILYYRGTLSPGIWGVPFSLERLETTGEAPFKVADGFAPSVSDDGTLLYLTGVSRLDVAHRLVWIDEDGQVEHAGTREQRMSNDLSLSSDESRALVAVLDDQNIPGSIWLHNLKRGVAKRVTFAPEGSFDSDPEWHPDGEHIVFTRRGTGIGNSRLRTIMKGRVDGSTRDPVEKIVVGNSFSLSMDGRYLAYDYYQDENTQARDIAYISLEDDAQPQTLRYSTAMERGPAISPDGRLLAYTSDESGQYELYLTQFPSGERRWLVSLAGGSRKFWGGDQTNQLLYYFDVPGQVLYRVSVTFDEDDKEPAIGEPEQLLHLLQLGLPRFSKLGPTRDGKRFLAAQKVDFDQEAANVVLVENWFSEFKNRESN